MRKIKLFFDETEIEAKLNKLRTKKSKINFLINLRNAFDQIFFDYTDNQIKDLLIEYNLMNNFIEENQSVDDPLIIHKFKVWFNDDIRPIVGGLLVRLKYNIDDSNYNKEQEMLNEEYPTYKFEVSVILSKCKDFEDYNERITYLEYCINKFRIEIGEHDEIYYDWLGKPSLKDFVPKLLIEIEKLKNESILINKLKTRSNKKPQINIKKFKWQGTEGSFSTVIKLFYNSGFLTSEDYNSRYAIIRDSFLNKYGEQFSNKQMSISGNRKTKSNETLVSEELITETNDDYTKFIKLHKLLNKLIRPIS